jgi:hypothetical protein
VDGHEQRSVLPQSTLVVIVVGTTLSAVDVKVVVNVIPSLVPVDVVVDVIGIAVVVAIVVSTSPVSGFAWGSTVGAAAIFTWLSANLCIAAFSTARASTKRENVH